MFSFRFTPFLLRDRMLTSIREPYFRVLRHCPRPVSCRPTGLCCRCFPLMSASNHVVPFLAPGGDMCLFLQQKMPRCSSMEAQVVLWSLPTSLSPRSLFCYYDQAYLDLDTLQPFLFKQPPCLAVAFSVRAVALLTETAFYLLAVLHAIFWQRPYDLAVM